ncbi:MAG: polysaccharide deacetylase family protein [Rhodospirillales bacterium]|nr:polysaccharide deacetylase family protein [Rhodospirillales bacterium]
MKTSKTSRLSPVLFIFLLCFGFFSQGALAASSAVIVMYHRFGEQDYPSTNLTLDQLDAHIAELTSGPYTVLPVLEIIRKLKSGEPLPERTVGITIDDAYRSIYTHAWPRLKAANLPFTVFVSTAQLDHGSSQNLSWDQVREMRDSGVTVGHHSVSHLHMPKAAADEIDKEILVATNRFRSELGAVPHLFAYPYGETSLAIKAAIKEAGFLAAFGQHSGVADGQGDVLYLPRFGLNERFGGIDRFRLIVNALSLPVREMTPADPLIGSENPPAIGFTVNGGGDGLPENLDQMSCFLSHEGQRAEITLLGPRVEIRARQPLPVGRTRLNCTMPAREGRWRWFGHQFIRVN